MFCGSYDDGNRLSNFSQTFPKTHSSIEPADCSGVNEQGVRLTFPRSHCLCPLFSLDQIAQLNIAHRHIRHSEKGSRRLRYAKISSSLQQSLSRLKYTLHVYFKTWFQGLQRHEDLHIDKYHAYNFRTLPQGSSHQHFPNRNLCVTLAKVKKKINNAELRQSFLDSSHHLTWQTLSVKLIFFHCNNSSLITGYFFNSLYIQTLIQ